MNSKHRELISKLVKAIDYDIWKCAYNEATAENSDEVEDNYEDLCAILEPYLK